MQELIDLIPAIIFGLSVLSGIAVGLPIGIKVLIKLIKDTEAALLDGKITQEEFELIIEDLLDFSKLAIKGLNWFLDKLKRK